MSPRKRQHPTKQRTVYLSETVYRASRRAAKRHPHCLDNWSMYVELALREQLAREQLTKEESAS